MAWTDPAARVWVTGEVVTAANLNTYVRLNLQALYDAPFCRVYNTLAQSVPTNAVSALTFDSERQDNDSIHSLTTNTSRLTATTAKAYVISGGLMFAGSAGGSQRTAILRLNGVRIAQLDVNKNAAADTALAISTVYRMAAGDYVELCAFQDSGGGLLVTASPNYSPELAMVGVSNG